MFNLKFSYRNNNSEVKNKYTSTNGDTYTGTYRDLNIDDITSWKNNDIKTYTKEFYKININTLKIYCLTIDENINRRKNIDNIFTNLSINYIHTPKANDSISKFQSGAIGISKILDTAIINFKNKNTFEPFIINEDDITKTTNYNNIINIPNDSDLIYLGISQCGLIDKPLGIIGYIYADNIVKKEPSIYDISYSNVVKIKNMLSTHAILVNSFSGLLMYQKAMIDAIINNRHYDIPMALQQPYYNIYALCKPIMCQDIKNGGQPCTNIELTEKIYRSNMLTKHTNYNLKNNLITKINN